MWKKVINPFRKCRSFLRMLYRIMTQNLKNMCYPFLIESDAMHTLMQNSFFQKGIFSWTQTEVTDPIISDMAMKQNKLKINHLKKLFMLISTFILCFQQTIKKLDNSKMCFPFSFYRLESFTVQGNCPLSEFRHHSFLTTQCS